MVLHSAITDTAVNRQTSAPSAAPNHVGEVYVFDTTNAKVIYVATGTASVADWVAVSDRATENNSDPNGLVTVRYPGQIIFDTASSGLYLGTTANVNSTTWVLISSGGGGGGGGGTLQGVQHSFSTTTTAPPSSTQTRLNNAAPASVTEIYVHDTDRNSLDVGAVLSQVTVGSVLAIANSTNVAAIAFYSVTSVTDNTTYYTYGVSHLAGTPSFTNGQDVTLQITLKGAAGAAGANGADGANGTDGTNGTDGADAGYSYLFDSTTTVGAIAGDIRFNNATVASVTTIYINSTDANTNDLQPLWTSVVAGSKIVISNSTSGAIAIFSIDSISGTTEQTLGVTYIDSTGTFSNNDALRVSLALKGDTGATGATGAAGAAGANGANGADGVVTYGAISTNAQTGTTYTLVLADQGKVVELNNASAIALTVPTNASVAYAVGTQILLARTGVGQPTVSGAGGVTVNSANGFKLRAQWSIATLLKRGTDTWLLFGDTEV